MTTVNEFLNLLAFPFEKGYEYSSTKGHRSAISTYHMQINNNSVGKHPEYGHWWLVYLIRDLLNLDLFLFGISKKC